MTYQIKNRAAVMQRLRRTARLVVNALATELQDEIRKNLNTGASHGGRSAGPAGGFPFRNTGKLAESIQIAYGDRGSNIVTARVGSNGTRAKYGRIHEFGGVITAKGRALTIPLNPEAKMLRQRTSGSLRGLDLILIVDKHRGTNAILYRKRKGGLIPMFLLKKSIRIPARPFMRPSLAAVKLRAKAVAAEVIKPKVA